MTVCSAISRAPSLLPGAGSAQHPLKTRKWLCTAGEEVVRGEPCSNKTSGNTNANRMAQRNPLQLHSCVSLKRITYLLYSSCIADTDVLQTFSGLVVIELQPDLHWEVPPQWSGTMLSTQHTNLAITSKKQIIKPRTDSHTARCHKITI